MHTQTAANTNHSMTIRRVDTSAADRDALSDLAERDSSEPLIGPVLGIEVEGRLLAAISLADGRVIADPFSRTAELSALLRMRAKQLRGRSFRSQRIGRSGRHAPVAVGGSPAGQILTLPH